MQVPKHEQCLHLFQSMQMPKHIQAHSRLVCQVALVLSDGLILAGIRLHRDLVLAAALLHDITKLRSFKTGENHAQSGCKYLTSLGFPEVGAIIRQHVILDHYFAMDTPIEAEVVNYADKRVLHDQIVTLNDRMAYIIHRYAKTAEQQQRAHKIWQQTLRLEQRLFAYLDFAPDELSDCLSVVSI